MDAELNKTLDKKTWTTPQLTLYGNVEEITEQVIKTSGSSDGILYLQPNGGIIPIGFIS